MPAPIVVRPENENVPAASRVSVPVPALVRLPAPLTVPASVRLFVPVVRVTPAPSRTIVLPAFVARALIVSLPPRESVAPEATVTPEVAARRFEVVVARVPAETVVAPV